MNRLMTRDSILRPIANTLTYFGIAPIWISLGGTISMGIFVTLILRAQQWWAIPFFAISIIADLLDGVVARYQNVASNRGRLVDLLCDATSFLVFMFGTVLYRALPPIEGMIIVGIFILLMWSGTKKAFQYAKVQQITNGNMRGFWVGPNSAKGLLYAAFLGELLTGRDLVEPVGAISIGLLFLSFILTKINTQA